jgi:DNA polymerase-3 subunit alpha
MQSSRVNYLWLDSETTGLDAIKNDVVQLACIPVIDNIIHTQSFNEYCQPKNWSDIDPGALKVNGLTEAQLKTFQSPELMVEHLVTFLKKFNTKFTIAGYNVEFDRGFISSLFQKVGRERDFSELFTSDIRDSFKRAKRLKSQLPTANIKLATLCAHFNIAINAHDALSDILATIKLDKILSDMLGDVDIPVEIVDYNIPYKGKIRQPAQLHCHSMYSYTDSLNSVKEWVEWCLKTNTPGFSAVDHGNAAALFEMTRIKDIIKELNKDIKDNKEIPDDQKTYWPAEGVVGIPGTGLHVELNGSKFYLNAWATTEQGYRNIIKMSSIGWNTRTLISEVEFPTLAFNDILSHKEGVVFGIPGVNGPVTQLLMSHQDSAALDVISYINQNLDVRLELAAIDVVKYFDSDIGFRSYNVPGGNIQKVLNSFYYSTAKKLGIKCVPVSDAHFLDPKDKVVADCLSKNSFKDDRYFFESRHQVTSEFMYAVLENHVGITESEFDTMVGNSLDIMERASTIKVKHDYHLPKIEIPEAIQQKTSDYDMQTYYYTMQLIKQHGRWNDSPEYKERFKKEIDVIMKNSTLNFLPYFLVYEDICKFARSSGLLQGIARGSAGGSLLSYYLKVIHVDPVANRLPFERFLSHARIRAGSFPDIDLDIADRARPLVMKYLQEKYNLGFAQIATFNKMKTKNAIKDAMWALYGRNRNDPEIKAVCDMIDDSPQGVDEYDFLYGYVDQEGEEHKGEVEKKEILANFFLNKPEVETMVKKLLGSIRGWSRHASAFVISTLDLSGDRLPTMIMDDKELGTIMVTQYNATMVEKSNLVKADILGIKTLSMASDAIALIKKNHGIDLLEEEKGVPLVYRLPDRDQGVFTDFYNRDTDSSFQFNTELIKGYAREFAPLCRADLSTMTALCRPGALDAPLYDTTAAKYYMDIKNGARTIEYLHADLEPILKDSNGVFVYQEEVMEFLVDIVGYTWEESDLIRSAIAKKKHEVIMNTFTKIRESCKARGWTESAIETICQQIQAFSRYSFNKSHSWAYGELGYITLYLKNHFKLEWWAGVLNNEDKEEKTRKYISYLGDTVSPPSLKTPLVEYGIQNGKIISPIAAIKGIGPAAVREIVSKGPFQTLEEYVLKVDHSKVNIRCMSAFVKARAADTLMDSSILEYIPRRETFMKKYCALRGNKTKFSDEMYEVDPIKIFLDEKETNQSFNKSFLSYEGIGKILEGRWPALAPTGRRGIPYLMGDAPVLASVKLAEAYLRKEHQEDVSMILLYEESEFRQGVSKKGKKWSRVSVKLSDGFSVIECTDWNKKAALRWPKNTIVYVRGQLRTGWKTPVSLTVSEIEKVE